MSNSISLFSKLRTFSSEFWFFNLIQMIERLAYASVVLQMAVYISQKDLVGGLHFDQSAKGWIFFFWAIIQNFTPVFFGGLSDKYGKKRIMRMSIIISVLGFFGIAYFRDVYLFAMSTIILGVGLGLFKPTIQGLISNSMTQDQKSIGWSINVMLINVAVFLAPPFAKYLEEISWFWVFAGSGILISINLILIYLYRKKIKDRIEVKNDYSIIKLSLSQLFQPKIIYFLLIMSGFTIIYMQFYESLPNFLYDWTDTSALAKSLNLPDFMLSDSPRGKMIDFKWLFNINSGLIVVFVVIVAYLLSRFTIFSALIIGLFLVTLGITLSGISHYGSFAVFGMIVYTFGEMISNPKIIEFMSKQGDEKHRSMYLGMINISFGIGLAGGSLLGANLYKNIGEKSHLAIRYIKDNYPNVNENITQFNSMDFLIKKLQLSNSEVSEMLFKHYHPQFFWLPFALIGIVSIILLIIYQKKYK